MAVIGRNFKGCAMKFQKGLWYIAVLVLVLSKIESWFFDTIVGFAELLWWKHLNFCKFSTRKKYQQEKSQYSSHTNSHAVHQSPVSGENVLYVVPKHRNQACPSRGQGVTGQREEKKDGGTFFQKKTSYKSLHLFLVLKNDHKKCFKPTLNHRFWYLNLHSPFSLVNVPRSIHCMYARMLNISQFRAHFALLHQLMDDLYLAPAQTTFIYLFFLSLECKSTYMELFLQQFQSVHFFFVQLKNIFMSSSSSIL